MTSLIVISLEKAKDRRIKMQNQLLDLQIDGFIMDAVDGEKLSLEQLNRRLHLPGGYREGELFKPGELGCTLSHIKALEWAQDKNWPYVIIIEDDVILAEDFLKRIKYLMKILPPDWDHIYLSGIPRLGFSTPPSLQFMNLVQSIFTECTSAMLINQKAYPRIISYLSCFYTTTDDSYNELIKNGLKSYTFYPFCACVEDTYIWNHELTREHKSKLYFRNKM
jgi:GR25 family glycosyltransferase involved in LPS biosynthesis